MNKRADANLRLQVQLRDVCVNDLPIFFEYQRDPESVRMAVVHPRDAHSFELHWTKILADDAVVVRTILADNAVAGSITCYLAKKVHYVGYWIGREFWGQGIATMALQQLLQQLSQRPLHARVARDNGGSICVLQRCGFHLQGYRMAPADDRYPACEEAILRLD